MKITKIQTASIFLLLCLLIPSTAHAYLDPGTGNALIYVILSIASAALYLCKGFFYKFVNRKAVDKKNGDIDYAIRNIVLFSEGKNYWNIFQPIVEKLIEKKQYFSYYTLDRKDPCLIIDDPYMENRYIGNGNNAFVKIGNLKANLVLVTTPNIGTDGYPIPRSAGIRELIYIPHSFDDIAFLHRGALNHYDAFMLTGDFQIQSIRKIENKRGLPKKTLYPAGLPYLDVLIKKAKDVNKSNGEAINYLENRTTVLLAPSWGEKGFLSSYGTDFIKKLSQKGFTLIVRPHPQSLKVEKKRIEKIKNDLHSCENIVWDLKSDATESFEKADILVSDVSAIRFEFVMVYQKPFITIPLAMTQEALQEFEIADLGSSWTEEAMQKIGYGYTLQENEIDNLDQIIMKVLQQKSNEAILDFRKRNIYNLGHSGEVIADYLIEANNRIQNDVKRDTD